MPRRNAHLAALALLLAAGPLAWVLLRTNAPGAGAAQPSGNRAAATASVPDRDPPRESDRSPAGSRLADAQEAAGEAAGDLDDARMGGTVRILDALTAQELSEVLVFDCQASPGCVDRPQIADHPGTSRPQTTPSPAPLDVRGGSLSGRVLVTAPGYAWSDLQVIDGAGRPPVVLLRPGCSLSVEIVGSSSDEGDAPLQLELRDPSRASGPPHYLLDVAMAGEALVFEHLLPGHYIARLQPPPAGRSAGRPCAASAPREVWLEAGAVVSLVFDLSERARAQPVRVAGIVRVPAGAEVRQVDLVPLDVACVQPPPRRVQLGAGPGELVAEGEGLLRWDEVPLAPGEWLVELGVMGYAVPVTIPAAPSHLVEIAPPEPVEVRVRLVDRATRTTRPIRHLYATTTWGGEATRRAGAGSGLSEELPDGARRMRVYPGAVRFTLAGPRGTWYTHVVDVRAPQDVVLEEHAFADVHVAAHAHGAELPLPRQRWTGLQVLDAAGEPVPASLDFGASPMRSAALDVRLHLPAPGSYSLDLLGARAHLELTEGQARADVVLDLGGR